MAVTQLAVTPTNPGGSSRGGSFGRDGGYASESFTTDTSAANARAFDFMGFSGASIYVSGACTITFLAGFASAPTTLYAAYDDTAKALTITAAAAGVYTIPPKLFGAQVIGVYTSGAVTARLSFKK